MGIFLHFVRLTTRTMHPMGVRRTCGEPDEVELTPIGVKVNTWIHDDYLAALDGEVAQQLRVACPRKRAVTRINSGVVFAA